MIKLMVSIFEGCGFYVNDDGDIRTTTLFAVFICEMLVKQQDYIKVSKNNYKIKEDAGLETTDNP